MGPGWNIGWGVALVGLTWIHAARAVPAEEVPRRALESEVKAAYLLNFLKFVDFPAPGARVICLLGQDPVGLVLHEFSKNQRVAGSPVIFRQIRSAVEADGCHILFVADDLRTVRSTLSKIAEAPIVTVSDQPDFLRQGGTILLFREAGRLQFEISLDQVRRTGLRVSSKLIVLSRSAR
jgi:hypothetical protein